MVRVILFAIVAIVVGLPGFTVPISFAEDPPLMTGGGQSIEGQGISSGKPDCVPALTNLQDTFRELQQLPIQDSSLQKQLQQLSQQQTLSADQLNQAEKGIAQAKNMIMGAPTKDCPECLYYKNKALEIISNAQKQVSQYREQAARQFGQLNSFAQQRMQQNQDRLAQDMFRMQQLRQQRCGGNKPEMTSRGVGNMRPVPQELVCQPSHLGLGTCFGRFDPQKWKTRESKPPTSFDEAKRQREEAARLAREEEQKRKSQKVKEAGEKRKTECPSGVFFAGTCVTSTAGPSGTEFSWIDKQIKEFRLKAGLTDEGKLDFSSDKWFRRHQEEADQIVKQSVQEASQCAQQEDINPCARGLMEHVSKKVHEMVRRQKAEMEQALKVQGGQAGGVPVGFKDLDEMNEAWVRKQGELLMELDNARRREVTDLEASIRTIGVPKPKEEYVQRLVEGTNYGGGEALEVQMKCSGGSIGCIRLIEAHGGLGGPITWITKTLPNEFSTIAGFKPLTQNEDILGSAFDRLGTMAHSAGAKNELYRLEDRLERGGTVPEKPIVFAAPQLRTDEISRLLDKSEDNGKKMEVYVAWTPGDIVPAAAGLIPSTEASLLLTGAASAGDLKPSFLIRRGTAVGASLAAGELIKVDEPTLVKGAFGDKRIKLIVCPGSSLNFIKAHDVGNYVQCVNSYFSGK